MNAPYVDQLSSPFACQKLLKLVEIWQSYDKNSFDGFLRHGVEI